MKTLLFFHLFILIFIMNTWNEVEKCYYNTSLFNGYGFHFQCCSIIIFREIQTSFKYYLHYIHMYYIEHTKLKGFFFLLVIRIYIFAVNVSLANENLENQFKIAKWKTETETKTEKKMKENVEWNCMYSSKK